MTSQSHFDRGRRRCDRVALQLSGRYMLADGAEFDCEMIDVSPHGVALRGPLAGEVGERVVAYVQELGRIEGVIVRRSAGDDWFALDLRIPPSRLHKLAKRIDALSRRQIEGLPDRRSFARFDQEQVRATLQLPDGSAFEAAIVDVSTGGVALEVAAAPPVGEAVTVGSRRAQVSRHFPGGVAVAFDRKIAAEPVETIETGRAPAAPG